MDGSQATGKTVDLRLVAHAAVMTLLGLLSGFTPAFATSPTVAFGDPYDRRPSGRSVLWFGGSVAVPRVGMGGEDLQDCALVGLYANWVGAQLAALVRHQGDVHRQRRFDARRERRRGWKSWWRCS
jgi:hypothetical protein